MRRFVSVASAALLFGAAPALAQSNSSGVMLSAYVNTTSLAVEDSDTSESGMGFGVRLGWGVTKKITLFVGLDTASIETEDPTINNGQYGLMEVDLGAIYNFRTGKSFLPYVEAGLSNRRLTSLVTIPDGSGGFTEGRVSTHGMAFLYGGGFNYFVARPVALNVGFTIAVGHFGDYHVDDTRVHNSDFTAASARMRLGMTWYPMKD